MTTTNTNTNSNSNAKASSFGDDILRAAGLKSETSTITLMLADTHSDRFDKLLPLVSAKDANVRDILLKDWYDTPAGETFGKRFAMLRDNKAKSPTQKEEFATMQDINSQLNTLLGRAVDTYRGIKILRDKGRDVTVRKVKNVGEAKIYACFVWYNNEALEADDRETADDRLSFYASELQRVHGIADRITDSTTTEELKALCSKTTLKTDTPNAVVAPTAGTAIEPSKVKEAILSLDTTIAKMISNDGHSLAGVSKETNDSLGMLWAKADAMFTDVQKAHFRKAYAEGVVADKAADVAKAEAAAKVKAEADAAAQAATLAAQAAPVTRRRRSA